MYNILFALINSIIYLVENKKKESDIMKTMKYGFINTSAFNRVLRNINKDCNYADVKENLAKLTKTTIKVLSK